MTSPFSSPEVRVVEASAGSGKTFALAKRYVQLLIDSSHQESALRTILAITFTNKAAIEMKARILEFLKKIALQKLSAAEQKEIVAPLGLTEEEAGRRAFRVMEALIRNYNFFQVQTIDSFINALLSGCSFKINLSANFDIRRNTQEYIANALDRLIDRAVTDKTVNKTFQQFLHQYLFIENRSGWFPKKDLLKILGTLFAQSNSFSLGYLAAPLSADDIFTQKRSILKLMAKIAELMPAETHATFAKKLPAWLKDHPESFDVDDVSDYFCREEFPVTKGGEPSRELDECWRKVRRELKVLCEMEAAALFNAYIEVFAMTVEEFRALAVKEDVLFLEELNKKARSLFDDGLVTVEELYYRLATRFHHYMVDEFQDTSRLQWENLALMVEEALSTGGSFFYVGDKKQAIYSFRGGDSRLFDEVKARFASFNVREEVLANNWRSRRVIVDFNNAIFSGDNIDRFIEAKRDHELDKNKKNVVGFSSEDRAHIHHVFANARQNARPGYDGGFVKIERILADKKEDREEMVRQKVLTLLEGLRGRFSLGDIAILTRDNSSVETITGWLLEAGVPVQSERTSNIKNNKTIQEIEALLRFLDSPIDNVNFAGFIMGEVFAKASGMDSSVFHDFIFELRSRVSRDATFYLYREFRERFPDLWDRLFEDFFKNVGLYPLYEFTVNVVERLGVIANFPGDRGFVMHFLGVIKNQEDDRGDLSTFLEYFEDPLPEDLFVLIRGHEAVRILTVHKAKGLEFPVVILPSLEMDVKVASGGKDGQQSFVPQRGDDGIRLVRLKDKYRQFSEQLNTLYEFEYRQSFLSELNNVYVALTRAVSELYAFIPAKAGSGTNPAQFLIPEDVTVIGEPVTERRAEKRAAASIELVPSLSRDWMGFLKDEFLDETLLMREARQRGEILHYVVSFLGNLDTIKLEECFVRARPASAAAFPLFREWAEVFNDVRKLVAVPRLKPFFYAGDAAVHCELEIVDAGGGTKRFDRLIVRKDAVDVIDFKSAREALDIQTTQVRQYMKILKGLYPERAIRGWLVYFSDGSMEQVE